MHRDKYIIRHAVIEEKDSKIFYFLFESRIITNEIRNKTVYSFLCCRISDKKRNCYAIIDDIPRPRDECEKIFDSVYNGGVCPEVFNEIYEENFF